MDFVQDGWLASFSEAVELYETTRFGEPLLFGNDRRARRSELHKAEKDGRVFNADEEAELSALDTEYRRIEKITYERQIETRNQLQQKLYADQIKASIQDRETGKLYSVPGHFWASDEAKKIFKPRPGIYPYVTINAFSVAHGPVRICREDVVKAAKPASDPPVSPTSGGGKAVREAEKDLRTRMQNLKLDDDLPVKANWVPDIVTRTGVSRRGAEGAWAKVSGDFPALASPKGKRKTKRADRA